MHSAIECATAAENERPMAENDSDDGEEVESIEEQVSGHNLEGDFEVRDPNEDSDGVQVVKKISTARLIADIAGCDREIKLGVTNQPNVTGWTDGDEYIALTEEGLGEGYLISWLHNTYRELIKQWAHTNSTEDSEEMEDGYAKRYFNLMNSNIHAINTVANRADDKSLRRVLLSENAYPDNFF